MPLPPPEDFGVSYSYFLVIPVPDNGTSSAGPRALLGMVRVAVSRPGTCGEKVTATTHFCPALIGEVHHRRMLKAAGSPLIGVMDGPPTTTFVGPAFFRSNTCGKVAPTAKLAKWRLAGEAVNCEYGVFHAYAAPCELFALTVWSSAPASAVAPSPDSATELAK